MGGGLTGSVLDRLAPVSADNREGRALHDETAGCEGSPRCRGEASGVDRWTIGG